MIEEPKITVIKSGSGFKFPHLPKIKPVVIIMATVILAVISVITALYLYQRRTEPVAPTAPVSKPRADEPAPTPTPVCSLCTVSFTILASPSPTPTTSPEPTPTPTGGPTPTPTPTPTSGEPNNCGGTCGSNANCNGGLFCYDTGVQKYCRNPQNPTSETCASLPGPTPTPLTLEEAGWVAGTWTISIIGTVLVTLGSILALAL